MFSFCVCHNNARVISVLILSIASLVLKSVYESASLPGRSHFFAREARCRSFHAMGLDKSLEVGWKKPHGRP
jgi:hypothetical protein